MTRIGRLTLLALALLTAVTLAGPRAARAAGAEKNDHGILAAADGGAEVKPELIRGGDEGGWINAVTTLIVFLVLVAVLGKFAWGPIAGGLKAREDKIRQDIAEAEAARARSEATLREYQTQLATAEQKVRDLLAKATTDAEQIAAGIRTRAQQDAEETKEKTTREIDAARRDAVRQVHEQAAVLATNVAEKILRRNLNADDQRDLVAASLDQLQMVKG